MCALSCRQVGWIVVLMVVFNYITACMMMLGMQASDPFHFGKENSVHACLYACLVCGASMGRVVLSSLEHFLYFFLVVCIIKSLLSCAVYFLYETGNVARAMFTMLRMQTLDSWDQILNIAIFGCDVFPAGERKHTERDERERERESEASFCQSCMFFLLLLS